MTAKQLLRACGLRYRTLALPGFRHTLRFLSHRGVLGRAEFLRNIPVNCIAQIAIDRRKFRCWFDTTQGLEHTVYWHGFDGWERESTRTFAELARKARGVLDVGANSGMYSMIACAVNPKVLVIAFEPTPITHARLRTNIAASGFDSRCTLRREALSNFCGTTHFALPDDLTMARMSDAGIEVPVTTADRAVPRDLPVDLVKIDVEGFEHTVLDGMREILERWHPAIIFEVLMGAPAREIESILIPLGYSFFEITHNGNKKVGTIDPSSWDGSDYRNFLAVYEL